MAAPAEIALVIPASNTVMEKDFRRMGRDDLNMTIWRLPLESVTREAEERMLSDELPKSLKEIAGTRPDLVVFGCTSASSLGGLAHDARIGRQIEMSTGAGAVTVVASMVEQLDARRPAQVALFTPYASELTRSMAACLGEAGFHVVVANGMGIEDNNVIGAMTPDEICDFVAPRMKGVNADCVFLSCTNWRAAEALEKLTPALGLPVCSSNQVTFDTVAERLAAPVVR